MYRLLFFERNTAYTLVEYYRCDTPISTAEREEEEIGLEVVAVAAGGPYGTAGGLVTSRPSDSYGLRHRPYYAVIHHPQPAPLIRIRRGDTATDAEERRRKQGQKCAGLAGRCFRPSGRADARVLAWSSAGLRQMLSALTVVR